MSCSFLRRSRRRFRPAPCFPHRQRPLLGLPLLPRRRLRRKRRRRPHPRRLRSRSPRGRPREGRITAAAAAVEGRADEGCPSREVGGRADGAGEGDGARRARTGDQANACPAAKGTPAPSAKTEMPAPAKPASSAKGFSVQLGAMAQEANAQNLKRKLDEMGFQAVVRKDPVMPIVTW